LCLKSPGHRRECSLPRTVFTAVSIAWRSANVRAASGAPTRSSRGAAFWGAILDRFWLISGPCLIPHWIGFPFVSGLLASAPQGSVAEPSELMKAVQANAAAGVRTLVAAGTGRGRRRREKRHPAVKGSGDALPDRPRPN